MCGVGQNRLYATYMTVPLVISLPKILFMHRKCMVLANPTGVLCFQEEKEDSDMFAYDCTFCYVLFTRHLPIGVVDVNTGKTQCM